MKLVNFGHNFIESCICNIFYFELLEYFLLCEDGRIAR